MGIAAKPVERYIECQVEIRRMRPQRRSRRVFGRQVRCRRLTDTEQHSFGGWIVKEISLLLESQCQTTIESISEFAAGRPLPNEIEAG
jgi:hypothetical protein